jgi:hypothetical protein
MIPHHLVNMNPEQETELRRLLARHRARRVIPVELAQNEQGFAAKRLEVIGHGSTEKQALEDLRNKELDALIDSVPIKKK